MKYFGTDGIRRESSFFFQENFLFRFAQAIVKTFFNSVVIIGRDTRLSGADIYSRLRDAFNSLGVNVYDLGVVPTPEVCYYTREIKGAVGIMISASHNPPEFNGLKVVDSDGFKIDMERERLIEEYIDCPTMQLNILHGESYTVNGAENYTRRILHGKGECLRSKRILLDCACGSASGIAKKIFTSLGASVDTICDSKDGSQINVGCGATNIGNILDKQGYDIAFSYDGDADRTLAVLDNRLVDGDDMIFALAQAHNAPVVAVTKMSNYGLDIALRNKGIDIIRVDIGDKHVQEAVMSGRAAMGAEQSGHIILSQEYCTGDGILASVEYLRAISKAGVDKTFHKLAQCLLNVRADTTLLASIDFDDIVREIESIGGRALIRASGTEPLIRVLVEADSQKLASDYANRIVSVIQDYLRQ